MERLLSTAVLAPGQILACDVRSERLGELHRRFGLRTAADNDEAAKFARWLVLATPPGEVLRVVREIRPFLGSSHLVISLAAGVKLAGLEQELGGVPVLRVMPNIPSLIGEGMNLVSYGRLVSGEARKLTEQLLGRLGRWLEVPDEQMDFWCALCAVGPTYIFPILEALAAAAAARGIPPEQALAATAQVAAGAARMAQQGARSLPALRQMISLRTLDEEEARRLFTRAYDQAVDKLQGLGHKLVT